MQLRNSNESADSQLVVIPEGEYNLSKAAESSEEALLNEQKNKELLNKDPTEYLMWLLDPWEEFSVDDKKIAKTIIEDTFEWKVLSMKTLLGMNAKEKSELVRKLTAIKPYMPSTVNEIKYRPITEWLREWKNIRKLKILWKDTQLSQSPTHEDLVTYFTCARTFHNNNIFAMYKELFLHWSDDKDKKPHIDSHFWNINENPSISEEFSNIWIEYFTDPEYLDTNTKA